MTTSPFARSLVRKSRRALRSARVDLQDGDPDGAVNRSYYAMFDIAWAALMSASVPEHELPRTHNGIIAAFWQQAVRTGLVEPDLAGSLSRTEALRLLADYTGTETDADKAADTLAQAEAFVATVERVFDLGGPQLGSDVENDKPDEGNAVSEPIADVDQMGAYYPHSNPISLEEERRQARENWLRLRQQTLKGETDFGQDRDAVRGADAGRSSENDRGFSLDIDLED